MFLNTYFCTMVLLDMCVCTYIISQGHFVKNLGTAGDKETETEVLLLEHDVPHQAFSQAVLSFLPKMPWSITEKVIICKLL